jgi:UDP-galactopyranose mutase
MLMSRDQNAGPGHDIKTDSSLFERVEEFKYLGKTLTHQNSIQEEIKSRLKSENSCYFFVKNLSFSSFLSKYIKLKYTEL